MKFVKFALLVLAGLWLVTVTLVGFGGAWLTGNVDTVADAALRSSGVQQQIDAARQVHCEDARAAYQAMWDAAVESGTIEQRQLMLDRAERKAEALCSAN